MGVASSGYRDAGQVGQAVHDRHAACLEPVSGIMPLTNENAVGSNRVCNFVVMRRITDENHVMWLMRQFPHPLHAVVHLAVGVMVIQSDQPGEVVAESEVCDQLIQRRLQVCRKDRLFHTGISKNRKHVCHVIVQSGLQPARLIVVDELGPNDFKGLIRKIETERAVVVDHRKIEHLAVSLDGQRRQFPQGQDTVHDVHTEMQIVQQGSIPIPDDMCIGRQVFRGSIHEKQHCILAAKSMSTVNPSPSPPRCILHVDMDAFYASIEQRDRPELRGKPVIVGSPPDKRGVVSAASYEARRFGVHSAMPSRTAGKLCPQGVFLPVDMARYHKVSRELMTILESFTPLVEPISVDEAFLDVTGARGAFDARGLAERIKQTVLQQLRLTASIGVAPNKYLAKLSSDMDKPNGLTMVPFDDAGIAAFLAPLPVRSMWGVGKKTAARLEAASIRTMGDLQALPRETLTHVLGSSAMATHVHALCRGRDDRPVSTDREPKSISNEHTYGEDCRDADQLRRTMIALTEKVGRRLRRAELLAETGSIKIRSADFSTITRQRRFKQPTDLDRDLLDCSLSLMQAADTKGPIRLIGFGVSGLTEKSSGLRAEQTFLFDDIFAGDDRNRQHRLDEAVDKLRNKYGTRSVRRGG